MGSRYIGLFGGRVATVQMKSYKKLFKIGRNVPRMLNERIIKFCLNNRIPGFAYECIERCFSYFCHSLLRDKYYLTHNDSRLFFNSGKKESYTNENLALLDNLYSMMIDDNTIQEEPYSPGNFLQFFYLNSVIL